MMTAPEGRTAALRRRPPMVDLATTWQAARDELLAREKAHTREGDAIAAARRRLPMMEFDGAVDVLGELPGGSSGRVRGSVRAVGRWAGRPEVKDCW